MNRAPEWGLAGVIITGGAGFIGSALARSIAGRGARVLVLDDLSTGSAAGLDGVEGVTMVQTDVRDAPTLAALFEQARPSIVYHLAALHYIPDCNRRPLDTVSINVNGTHNVLEASARTRVRRFIFASSAAVYAPTDERISEDHPVGPIDTYGASKLYGEILCRDFAGATGISTTICRFFNVYGPNDTVPHLMPALIQQILAGAVEVRLGNLTPRRDYIHIVDLVNALLILANQTTEGCRTYNLGSGVDHSVKEVAELSAAMAGRPLAITQDPARVRVVDRTRLVANIDRARKDLGWSPTIELPTALRTLLRPKS